MDMPIEITSDITSDSGSTAVPPPTSFSIWPLYAAPTRSAFGWTALIAIATGLLFDVWLRGRIDSLALLAACGVLLSIQVFPRPKVTGSYPRKLFSHVWPGLAAQKSAGNILIVGSGTLAQKLYRSLDHAPAVAREPLPKGVIAFPDNRAEKGTPVDLTALDEIVRHEHVSRIVIAEENVQNRAHLASALVDLRLRGLQVEDAFDFYENYFGRVWIESLSTDWFVCTSGFHHSRISGLLKRFVDIAGSLLLLILTSPLLVLVAVAIKLESDGPILFRQFRIGLFGRPFVIYKFRSMRRDAELQAGPKWASENDPRMTRLGKLLRKFRIDEIPQAINVLRGEMSLVGPRPERPCFFDKLTQEVPFYELRHYVKPGITGWAQVKYRYGASIEDTHRKLQYDIYYAKHRSFTCDVKIMFLTIGVVLFGKGQ